MSQPNSCCCERNPAGDIRCHRCGERVNIKCWKCGTPRGEGPCPNPGPATPAEPTEDERY